MTNPLAPPSGLGADPTSRQEYLDALAQAMKAVEGRQNTNWFNIAGALMAPTRSGSFGESVGNAATVYGKQQEEQEARALPIAQMRAQIAGQKYKFAQEEQARRLGAQFLADDGGEQPTTAPAPTFINPLGTSPLQVTSPSGPRTLNGKDEVHPGFDLHANENSALFAPAAGTISRIGPMGGYGNAVEIKYDNGQTALFAHLNDFNKNIKPGDKVSQGEVLGVTGNTGKSTGPHLHVEHRDADGNLVDPTKVYGAPAPQGGSSSAPQPVRYDAKTKAAMAIQLSQDPEGFIKEYGKQGMEFARNVALEREKARIDDAKRTELQKNLSILNDPNQPASVKMAVLAHLNVTRANIPFDVRGPGGTTQSTPMAETARAYGLPVPGAQQGSLQAPSGAPQAPVAAPQASGVQPSAPMTPAAPEAPVSSGFTPGSAEDLAIQKARTEAQQKADIEIRKQEAEKRTTPYVEKGNFIAGFDHGKVMLNEKKNNELMDLVTQYPHVVGLLVHQGVIPAVLQAAESGISTPWGSLSLPVTEALSKLVLNEDEQGVARNITQLVSDLNQDVMKAGKNIYGPQISVFDAQQMAKPGFKETDPASFLIYLAAKNQVINKYNGQLSQAYSDYFDQHPNASTSSFFQSPRYKGIINQFNVTFEDLISNSPYKKK